MIIHGDCLEVMKTFPDNRFSAIVTDPPYGLSFMGKGWDHAVPGRDYWEATLRIIKPGGFLVSMGGTRTFHRLASAIEDSGYEIRDCLMWLYGSGFPKSHNISKGIDKKRNDDIRPVCRFLRNEIERSVLSIKNIADRFSFHPRMIEHWAARDTDSQPSIPTNDQWVFLKELIGFSSEMDEEVFRLNGRKGQWGESAFERGVIDTTGGLHGGSGNTVGCFTGKQLADNPILELAKQFDGYGTALKPAYEPIILAMKPLDGTFKQNAEKWDQAGINVDGCRIGSEEICTQLRDRSAWHGNKYGSGGYEKPIGISEPRKGRWPANVILDEEAAKMLDEQSEIEASRFFYCAKASSRERNEGLEGMPEKEIHRYGEQNQGPLDQQTPRRAIHEKNHHPTVKPLKLMEYLIRLVMPPSNGLLLDPFAGSGTTILAAKRLGFEAIGIEKSEEYCEIARKRIEACIPMQGSLF